MSDLRHGDKVTDGVLWRGIGPAQPPPGRGKPYEIQQGKVVFSDEAFWDRMDSHPDPAQKSQRRQRPSFILASLCGEVPAVGLAQLKTEIPRTEALTGIEVPEILKVAGMPNSDWFPNPSKSGTVVPALEVVFEPEKGLPAHAVVTPRPEFHPRKVFDRMRDLLAVLASKYHANNGWVSPPP